MATNHSRKYDFVRKWAAGVAADIDGNPNHDQKELLPEVPDIPESTGIASDAATATTQSTQTCHRQHESTQSDLFRTHNLKFTYTMPIDVGSFTDTLARIKTFQSGKRIFPSCLELELAPILANELQEVSHTSFGAYADKDSCARATLGVALEIQKAAMHLLDESHDKWVSSTISRLLGLVKTQSKRTELVKVTRPKPKSIKTKCVRLQGAQIEQETMRAGVKVRKSSGIEFALCMNPTKGERGHLIQLMQSRDFWTISPVTAANLHDTPVAIPMHVQVHGSPTDSHLQLAYWTLAQLNIWQRLDLLAGMMSETLFFPLISIRGPHWQLCIIECRKDGQKTFYGEQMLGDMRKLEDIYKILACVRRLHRWINEAYRPWYQKQILTAHLNMRSKRKLEETSVPEAKRVRRSSL